MRRTLCLAILCLFLVACDPLAPSPSSLPVATATASVQPGSTPMPTATAAPSSLTSQPQPAGWWQDAVFYELFVRSFYDSDGDGIGDLPGLIQKLDYLNDGDPTGGQDLGVTGLWLMPIFASPSYHGYDTTDYYTVNPEYGTNDDFRRLVDEAHRRGVRIIIDLMLNHTSNQHPWFVDSASGPEAEHRDWYIWRADDPGYLGPWGQPVWHAANGAYYYGVFWSGMPDLNLANPEVTAELYRVARFWLEEMGADGFRLDAAHHYIEDGWKQTHTPASHEWLRAFYGYSKEVAPEMMAVAEVWDESDVVSTYTTEDVDLAFEFSLAESILRAVDMGWSVPLASTMKEVQGFYPDGGYATFLTNHDQNRVMNVLGYDEEKAKMAATLLLTLPGVPFVYYGEEIGMSGAKPDELIRTPMHWTSDAQAGFTTRTPWEPLNEGYEGRNVALQLADAGSLLNHYRALVALRLAQPALRGFDYAPADSADPLVYAYLRGGRVLVVANLGDKATADYALSWLDDSLPPGQYRATDLLTGSQAAMLNVDGGGQVVDYLPLPELPARSALLLELLPAGE